MTKTEVLGQALMLTPELKPMERILARATVEMPIAMSPAELVAIAATTIRQFPELAQSPASLIGAILVCAQLRLKPVAGIAYILPFWNKNTKKKEAQFVLGYPGLADLFYRHEKSLLLESGIVKENDQFDYEYGMNKYLRHKEAQGDRGETVIYYVIATLAGGEKSFRVMTREECMEHGKKHSKTYDAETGEFSSSSPWAKDQDSDWMCLKTVLKQLSKFLPKSIELQRAIMADETSREYQEGINDVLDVAPIPWEDEPIETEEKFLEIGSPLHKKFEAIIGKKKWGRVLLHEFLLQKGKLNLVDGSPSFTTLKESFVDALVNDPERLDLFETAFNNWLQKKDKSQE